MKIVDWGKFADLTLETFQRVNGLLSICVHVFCDY
jgi:hypothetical protein